MQAAWWPLIPPWGIRPDLVMLLVVSWSLVVGVSGGLRWALIGGIALDLISIAPMGVATGSLALAAFLGGLWRRRPSGLGPRRLGQLAILAALYQITTLALLAAAGWPLDWRVSLQQASLPATALDVALLPVVYSIAERIHRLGQPAIQW
ncbi:MAG: rod shape-determining protein MreD [Chloroflexi bacterium]|nr:rod shape-determining protein MreD [Chloroflexota bacterium]